MTNQSIIHIQGLRNQFGSQVVHDNLDLDVYRGEILGVVGGSGSGKSVLLRSIIGLQTPAAGTVELLGTNVRDIKKSQLEKQTGVLFQSGALYSSMTVAENISVPLIENCFNRFTSPRR